MDTWEGYLHWVFLNEYVLLPSIRLGSFWGFLSGSLLTIVLCLAERLVTFAFSEHWVPSSASRSRWQRAFWRTSLYWMATFLRLMYMLIAMSCHLGLILVIVTTLAVAQFFIELHSTPQPNPSRDGFYAGAQQPLLHSDDDPYALTRPRSKSKPEDIFIHPIHSNLARADAAAIEMGLGGDTEHVHGNRYPHEEAAWELGKGKDVARALLGSHHRQDSHRHSFRIGVDDDEQDSDSS